MNTEQALNWAKIADLMARRSVHPNDVEDVVQTALMRMLEGPEDHVKRIWEARMAARNEARSIARERLDSEDASTHPDGGDPWLTPDDTISESWLQMLEEEDRFEERIREAYEDPDEADEAVAAQSPTPFGSVDAEWEEMLSELEEVDTRRAMPIYMQPEWRVDRDMARMVAQSFKPGWVGTVHLRAESQEDVLEWLEALGKRAVVHAWEQGLTPPECAYYVNLVARTVADEAPEGDEGLYYGAFRYAAGDHMALAGEGAVGAHSSYTIEDEDVWAELFPQGFSDEKHTLPKGSPSDAEDLVGYVSARREPEDVSVRISPFIGEEDVFEYQGWNIWDTALSRKVEAICALGLTWDLDGKPHMAEPQSWRRAAKAGRDAFWQHLRADSRKDLLRRHYRALNSAGLMRDRDDGYEVKRLVDEPVQATPSTPTDDTYWDYIMAQA